MLTKTSDTDIAVLTGNVRSVYAQDSREEYMPGKKYRSFTSAAGSEIVISEDETEYQDLDIRARCKF